MSSVSLLESIGEVCQDLGSGARVYIAYSGGVDSQVLLHAASIWTRQQGLDATALHLNHGLSPNADDWQNFCARQCKALGLALLYKKVELDKATSGLELRAREARYAWFESLLESGDVLLMAHHREDQAETFVLRAMRGSGVRGLAAIPATRPLGKGRLLRPFLNRSKAALFAYAEQHDLSWIEDESNLSLKFDRNFIRHQIMPRLAQRWPQVSRQLLRSAQNCQHDQQLLDELAALDVDACQASSEARFLEVIPPLNLNAFRDLSITRQRNVLQYLLRPLLLYPVPVEQMNEWLRQVNKAVKGAQSKLKLEGLSLILHDGLVHFSRSPGTGMVPAAREWCTLSPLEINTYDYELSLVSQARKPLAGVKTLPFEAGETVCVHWRQGGERVQLQGEEFSRALKKLFQEKRLAPWLRRDMPLISVDGYIVWSALLGDFSPRLVDAQGRYYSFELRQRA
jgi:tRNA(Ile)-lysidine synthase